MEDDVINKIRAFNRFYTEVIGVTNNHILESNYSLTEVRTMYEIYHNPGITAREIKEILKMDEGYLSHLIAKLVKKNIIKRTQTKGDNRIFSLALTQTGENTFLKLNQLSSDAVAKTIQHLTKSEQIELIQSLDKIKKLITKSKT
ncbi:MAG TPA: MarR family winged helix-turn-helix transcriptional regulator [Puia sp.]|jgi:DNA-binding MarR family transcriptional regulator